MSKLFFEIVEDTKVKLIDRAINESDKDLRLKLLDNAKSYQDILNIEDFLIGEINRLEK